MRRRHGAVTLTTLVLPAPVGRAWAHEGEEDVPARDSVQEAIAIVGLIVYATVQPVASHIGM